MDAVDEVTDYVYSGLNVIDEIRGGAHEKHVYAGSMHLASVSGGAVENYHVDHLGSTRLKTNSNGGVIYESNYEPNGPGYGESGSEEFKYTGKHEDPSGLYYFGARYYNPEIGRFITEDPVLGSLEDPQGLNRYVYSRNNPLKYTDPDGRFFANILVGAVVGGIIGGGWYALTHIGTLHTRETQREVVVHAVSGAVSGAVISMGGPALCVAGKIALKAAATTLSWSTENMMRGVMGGPIEPQSPGEIINELYTSTLISATVGEAFTHVPPGIKETVTNKIGETVPFLANEYDVLYYRGEPETSSIANMLVDLIPPRVAVKAVRHVTNPLFEYREPGVAYWSSGIYDSGEITDW